MGSLGTARRILLPFLILWTTGRLAALSVGLEVMGAAQGAAAPGFGPKLQAGGSVALILSIPLAAWMDLTTSLEGFGILPSDAAGGFLYRGFGGAALGAVLEAHATVLSSAGLGALSLGAAAGAAAALPAYRYTTLYFFYPEVRLAGFLSWRPASMPALVFRLDLPVRIQLRRDVSWALSSGLGVGASYTFGAAK
jgi:hypothetical protein